MKIAAIILGIVIVALLGVLVFLPSPQDSSVSGGTATTTNAGTASSSPILVSSPQPNATISSPAEIFGTVTGGGWFFEATFPVKVIDADGTVLGQGPAQAQGDWTSTGTVAFLASVAFAKPHSATGTIVLSKDNPSGAPQNEGSFVIPVRFR